MSKKFLLAPPVVPTSKTKESVLLQGRTLLLADDSIAIQKVVELTFEDEGMTVVCVGDGQQAIERLGEVRPDVVLADVFMPELNGYQVCERIKGDERFRHIPVILLVGSFEPFNEAEARRVGADDYLTKPFQSIRQMVSKVGSLLSGKKSIAEADIKELPAEPETAKQESQPHTDNWELATADTAPLPQHMRGAMDDSSAPAKKTFDDLQMDDPMIEETSAGEFGSSGHAMAGSQQRPVEPPAAQEFAEAGMKSASLAPGQQYVASNEPSAHATNRVVASDDSLLDLDDVEMPHSSAMTEADDFILDLQDAAEAAPQQSAPVEAASPSDASESPSAFALVEEQPAHDGDSYFYQPGAPPPETAAVPETQTPADSSQMRDTFQLPSEPQVAPTEKLPESFQPEAVSAQGIATGTPEAAPVSEPPYAQPGQIGLDQLSPEAIEAIARRVIEQLSAKVIEQIAWEVVPQLSELIIKRRLEEKE